ncbi:MULTISPECIES: UTP--glucose-1-phosphate uridylyltransferase GalU [Bacillaceae]|uniref:UTP--glucose-1-phosphate uridylyltransferase n=2 Tax=Metabacillus TaxID=2675233 RepID=A0ABS5LIE0_9BACI|nr:MULTISPECIES: UTP--glucose-1-phosphate uridylyltransferase GalU [Bacillaceae]KZZ82583.1 UTP--glucose-1-phosphate uridylyltransferase [Bacillus sp. SJS]MBS2970483.1 UTP--glucose-1-phosphate uridylyltransferase GalU [Metabacillus flavus]
MKVRKAIIPAAGLGTRFLPATKAQPKEMLPIVDKPTIQYIVEEAIKSGIEDILVISGRGKRAIEDHFDKSYELEETLYKKGKFERLEEIQSISNMANIHYVRQKEPRGLGHAIHCAESFIGNEPFAVLLGDDIVKSETPCLKQLIDVFEKYDSSVLGVQEVEHKDVSKYGIIAPLENKTLEEDVLSLSTVVEKPAVEQAPSNYAIMGRYILTPEIFSILETLPPGSGNEIQLTDAIKILNESQTVLAYNFAGKRYDVGDKFGFVKATIDFALERGDLGDQVHEYLSSLVKEKEIILS